MNYIQCEQIDPLNLSGNVFGNNHNSPKLHPDAPTSEINGHEVSLLYQYDEHNDPLNLFGNAFSNNHK